MFTIDQEVFLADFADKGIAEAKATEKRNIDDQIAYEAKIARNEFVAQIKDEKEQEIMVAVADYDAAHKV